MSITLEAEEQERTLPADPARLGPVTGLLLAAIRVYQGLRAGRPDRVPVSPDLLGGMPTRPSAGSARCGEPGWRLDAWRGGATLGAATGLTRCPTGGRYELHQPRHRVDLPTAAQGGR